MTDFATLAIRFLSQGADRTTTDLTRVGQVARQTEQATAQLATGLKRLQSLLALSGITIGVSQIVQLADKMQSLRNQVQFVTGSISELNQVQNQLFDMAQRTRASLESTTQLYIKSSQALKDYGYAQKDILKFTETINKAMVVGGVDAQSQASALLQLSQALSSGQLQGDEFKTIAESAPIILDVLAEYMGKSRAEVKSLASEGKLTAKLLFEAFSQSSEKINAKFEQMPISFGGAMQQIENSFMQFIDQQNQAFGLTSHLAEAISFLAKNMDMLAAIIASIATGHLVKFVATITLAKVASFQQSQANLAVARTAQTRAVAELAAARADMQALNASLALAQSEQTRSVIRRQMAQQAALITSLKNAETVATQNLATASAQASVAQRTLAGASNLLKGAMGLLGGPAGVITLAAGALFYFYTQAQEAKAAALDTAAANDRLKESYDNLSAAALSLKIKDQQDILENYRKQIQQTEADIRSLKQNWQIVGLMIPDSVKKELDELNDKLTLTKENANIDFSVLEKQLEALARAMLSSGKSVDEIRQKFKVLGVDASNTESILNRLPDSLANVSVQTKQATTHMLNFDDAFKKINERSQTLQQRLGVLTLKAQGHAKASYVLAGLYEVLNVQGARYSEVLNAIARGDVVAAEAAAKAISLSTQQLNEMWKAAQQIGQLFETDQKVQHLETTIKTQEKEAKPKKTKAVKDNTASYLKEWQQYYNELERANADSWAKIALEEQRSLNEMLEKAKKANASSEQIEKAKTLIAERYAKERRAIAEKYAPELAYQRQLKEQLAEIQAAEKGGFLTQKQAQQAQERVKWDSGEQIAKQAGENAVSGYDQFIAQFDPAQAEINNYKSKQAELQSYYDQNLIAFEEFNRRKQQIEEQYRSTLLLQDLANYSQGLQSLGNAFGQMADLAGQAMGKQSSVYKTMFGMAKAFAIADSMLKLQQAIVQVMADSSAMTPAQKFANMAAVASAGMNVISQITSANMSGMAHSGIDNIPKEGTWLLDKGERVVDSRTNQDLKTFLANTKQGRQSGKSTINVKIINNGQPVNAEVKQEETADGTQITVALLSKVESIANGVYTKRQQQDLRSGGVLARY